MNIINIGIVAHVDAGKTTVTENILCMGGVIEKAGRVDDGNTQTDSMELERKRGITIKSSVVSFDWRNVKINILDTPGHADFVSEVERALSALDGAILVVSAVEGIQAHTLMLFKVLKRLRVPTIIFINKLDRLGSDCKKVVAEMKKVLDENIILLQRACEEGTNQVNIGRPYDEGFMEKIIENLCEIDESLLEAYIEDKKINRNLLERKIQSKARRAKLYPVFLGAALKGMGIECLMDAIVKYLPYSSGEINKPLSAVVFKIDNTLALNKKVYVRLFEGEITLRDSVLTEDGDVSNKVKGIALLKNGEIIEGKSIEAGDIGILYGLKGVKIGQVFGRRNKKLRNICLSQPILKTKVSTINGKGNIELYEALSLLAEEDPLLQLEVGESKEEIFLNFFGEVQMEILKAVLYNNYGIKVQFDNISTIYKETVNGNGNAKIDIWEKENFFSAGVGLRVEPLERGKGIIYTSEVPTGHLPRIFQNGIEDGVHETLKQGLLGWELTDLKIILEYGVFDSVTSTTADFRNLTPMVLMKAVSNAGTSLLEPIYEFQLRISRKVCGKAISDLSRLRAKFDTPLLTGDDIIVEGVIPVSTSQKYGLEVTAYSEGKGMFVTKFHGYSKIPLKLGKVREKQKIDPLNKKMYMLYKLNALRR